MITCRCITNTFEVNGRCHVCKLPKLLRVVQPDDPSIHDQKK